MTSTADRPAKYKVVGTSPIRPDGMDKVTGRAIFGDDIRVPGVIYGKVLRSPHAHAKIKRIDVSAALKVPGVRAVATHGDFPPIPAAMVAKGDAAYMSLRDLRNNALASDKVLYKGHSVAAIAADNPHVAEEALSKIVVEYEVLKPVMDAPSGLKADAPVIHEKLNTISFGAALEKSHPNALHIEMKIGDIEQGFKMADVIVEREFNTRTIHQGYIEPQSCTVDVAPDGSMTVWSTTQGAFAYRDQLSRILQIPQHKIKVIPTEIGGGFGGKEVAYIEPAAAVLSRKAGRPVRIAMSRADVLQATGPACGSYMKVKMGATKDGRMVAAQAYLAFEAGAYPGAPVVGATGLIFGRYTIPHQSIDGYDVIVNKPKTQPYRAPGATQAHFSAETVVDELAEKIGMDPVEFRMINVVKEGDRNVQGVPYPKIGAVEVLSAIRNHPHYKAPLGGPNRGRGIALGLWRNGGGMSTCIITVNSDGTVTMVTGSPDLSGTRTSIGMQAAETLGIPFEDVKPIVGDTESIPYTMGSWGSSTTFGRGYAAHEAAVEVNKKMAARAAQIWGTSADNVQFKEGVYSHKSDPNLKFTFKQLAEKLNATGGPIQGSVVIDPTKGVGLAFAACIVDVEVDTETGKIQTPRVTVIQDVGVAIHHDIVVGQMQGGTVQALGWALNEEYWFDSEGRMANSSLLDYRMPTALDVPMIDTMIVEVPNPGHPYGVRGVGENSIVAPPAAVANAVYKAIGVRMTDLPLSPGSVLNALWKKQGKK